MERNALLLCMMCSLALRVCSDNSSLVENSVTFFSFFFFFFFNNSMAEHSPHVSTDSILHRDAYRKFFQVREIRTSLLLANEHCWYIYIHINQ